MSAFQTQEFILPDFKTIKKGFLNTGTILPEEKL
jgi:hypothetical protein